ncbi:MAG: hypothetical protein HRU20_07260 [Pseudomonadales bacterium]|nr:hypothetical protein [Pseudomonadales bacterium]
MMNNTNATTLFEPDMAGIYTLTLTINDGETIHSYTIDLTAYTSLTHGTNMMKNTFMFYQGDELATPATPFETQVNTIAVTGEIEVLGAFFCSLEDLSAAPVLSNKVLPTHYGCSNEVKVSATL